MRLMTILGTRPEIIRLSKVIPILDEHCDHVLVHTGQNYDPRLNEIFFKDLKVRAPDVSLHVRGETAAQQIGQIIQGTDQTMADRRPDALLVLGDTNSGLSAIMAKRRGIRVFHMEAGNRCFDDRVPEEVNRRIIDHSSDVLMPYTERSRDNLLAEGIPSRRIYVTGNPIYEVLTEANNEYMWDAIQRDLRKEGAAFANKRLPGRFVLLTAHRAENVDDLQRLQDIIDGASRVGEALMARVIFSVHPRTMSKMTGQGFSKPDNIVLCEPFDFTTFVLLEKRAVCVLTDSGTVQEECCILGTPNVTIRDTTERPETIEVGSNIVCGTHPDDIVRAAKLATKTKGAFEPPPEYKRTNVAVVVTKIVLGYYHGL